MARARMSDGEETCGSDYSLSDNSDSSYEEEYQEEAPNRLPEAVHANYHTGIPPTPRAGSIPLNRLSLDGKELYVPALGLNRLPISSSTSPLQSARPQPRGDARAPLQGTENTLSRGLAKAPTVKLPSFKTDGLSAPQLSQPQDPAGYPSEMTVYKLDVLAEGLELPASNFVATKNSRGSRGPAASSLKMEAAECLDVGTENIRLFELKELQSDAEASASCTQFAVQIAGAGFSLQTLEQQLAKNNELKAIAKEELLAREALQEQVWQQTERLAKAEQRVIEMENQLRQATCGKELAGQEAGELRQRLSRCELVNAEAKVSLEQLKGEVGYLATAITNSKRRNSKSASSSPARSPGTARNLRDASLSERKGLPGRRIQHSDAPRSPTASKRMQQSARPSGEGSHHSDLLPATAAAETPAASGQLLAASQAEDVQIVDRQARFVNSILKLCTEEHVAALERMVSCLNESQVKPDAE